MRRLIQQLTVKKYKRSLGIIASNYTPVDLKILKKWRISTSAPH
jgi:hypothetical protein